MEWLRWILLAVGAILIGAIYVAGRRHQRPRGDDPFPTRSFGADADGRGEVAEAERQTPTFAAEPTPTADPDVRASEPTADPWNIADEFAVDPVAVEDRVELDEASGGPVERERAEPLEPAPEAVEPAPAAPASEASQPDVVSESESASEDGPAPVAADRADRSDHSGPREAPPAEHLVVLYVAAAEGRRLVGAQLAQAFARHGLEHGELGAFHARARDGSTDASGRPVTEFSVANVVEPGSFDPATMDTLSTPGIVLILRVPGPPAPLAAFERMVVTARDLARELEGRVLDEKRTPLTRQSEQLLRDDLRQRTATPERSP